jgi:hypothetical protein
MIMNAEQSGGDSVRRTLEKWKSALDSTKFVNTINNRSIKLFDRS